MFLLLIFVIGALYLLYMCWHFRLFSKQGVPVDGTRIPVLGTLLPVLKKGFVAATEGKLEKYGKNYGSFSGRFPVLNTYDLDVIKDVFIKDHASFHSRFSMKTGDKVMDNMLTRVNDHTHWKYLRSVMTPSFSSGKLRKMMDPINRCATQLQANLVGQDGKSVEIKEFAGSFTMDVIASTAFGLELNAQEDRSNPFVLNAQKALDFSLRHPVILIFLFCPCLMPLLQPLKLSLFKKDVISFFTDVIEQALKARQQEGSSEVVDFLQLMVKAHKEDQDSKDNDKPTRSMTHDEIVAQAFLFFLAGYDTTATTISFLSYNLACNQDKQEKLLAEIDSVMGGGCGKTSVDESDLHNMPYLEMCINESMRLYPAAPRIMREAQKDVVIKGIHLPKSAIIAVPVYHLHRSKEYYDEPLKFIPERFSPEEKAKRNPLSFLPFGAGPRQCIASRLAMIEVKVAMAHVLKEHKFVLAPETEIPIKLAKTGLLKAENGIWLRLEKRTV